MALIPCPECSQKISNIKQSHIGLASGVSFIRGDAARQLFKFTKEDASEIKEARITSRETATHLWGVPDMITSLYKKQGLVIVFALWATLPVNDAIGAVIGVVDACNLESGTDASTVYPGIQFSDAVYDRDSGSLVHTPSSIHNIVSPDFAPRCGMSIGPGGNFGYELGMYLGAIPDDTGGTFGIGLSALRVDFSFGVKHIGFSGFDQQNGGFLYYLFNSNNQLITYSGSTFAEPSFTEDLFWGHQAKISVSAHSVAYMYIAAVSEVSGWIDQITFSVPEPSAIYLLGSLLIGLGYARRRKREGPYRSMIDGQAECRLSRVSTGVQL